MMFAPLEGWRHVKVTDRHTACRVSPKLEELEGILGDLLEEPERKIIVFSEWERMLSFPRRRGWNAGPRIC
jgi:hypothetical protein